MKLLSHLFLSAALYSGFVLQAMPMISASSSFNELYEKQEKYRNKKEQAKDGIGVCATFAVFNMGLAILAFNMFEKSFVENLLWVAPVIGALFYSYGAGYFKSQKDRLEKKLQAIELEIKVHEIVNRIV